MPGRLIALIFAAVAVVLLMSAVGGCGGASEQQREQVAASGLPLCTAENFPATMERIEQLDRRGGVNLEDGFGYGDESGELAVLLVSEECEVVKAPDDWAPEDRIFSVGR